MMKKASYSITINANITGNPLQTTKTVYINLYAYNPNCNNYKNNKNDIYDTNSNNNKDDLVGFSTTSVSLIAPTGLLTIEFVTDYDDLSSRTIAPNVAEIEKADETRTAKININMANNYSGTISEISILGKIPFEGNTYVLNNENLKSEFSTNLKGAITVPEALQEYVTVYYSEKETPDKDIQKEQNGWKLAEEINDWKKIKTFLIDSGEYSLKKDESEIFTYEVEVPKGVGYNEASFSSHAIFYCLDTENGKLETKLQISKVGLQVVSKYKMQITKNKKTYNNMFVSGATYKVTCKDANDNIISSTATTNDQGILTFKGLYIEREYTLREIVAPDDYILDKKEIKFVAKFNDNGELTVETKEGEFKNTPEVAYDENGNYLVKAAVEDEAKYTLKIDKKDENGNNLPNVKFSIIGKGKKSSYRTNSEGKFTITGLFIDEEYSIQETKADGYYVDQEPKKFKITRNSEGKLELQSNDNIIMKGEAQTENKKVVVEIDEKYGVIQAIINFEVPNEKIPTYDLQIIKVEEDLEEEDINNLEKLEGAYFAIESVDTNKQEENKKNENGIAIIPDLYQYVEGKYIKGECIIRETKSPAGYSNNAEEIILKVGKDEEGKLKAEIEDKENLKTYKDVVIEENTVKLVLQDKPLFELTKIDSETGEPLANVKFVIYELNEEGKEIDYAKDVNGNYVGIKDEDDCYIVTTNEEGKIILPLRGGTYKAVEAEYPEGYQEKNNETIFKVADVIEEYNSNEETEQGDTSKIVEINYIDDLVDLSNAVNNGNKYEGYTIKLKRDLDFEDPESYKDGSVKQELTKAGNGEGFTPIGTDENNCFSGTFDGKGNEIRNIYINTEIRYAGLFGEIYNAKIKRLGVTGNVSNNSSNNFYIIRDNSRNRFVGGIAGYINNSQIENSYNIGEIEVIEEIQEE